MGGPDKVFGAGKRDSAHAGSAARELPSDDQKAYRTIDPARGPTPGKAAQRRAARRTGIRHPEEPEAPAGGTDKNRPL